MSNIDTEKVDHALELICQNGCGRVWEIIEGIEQGELPTSASELNAAEQALLLEELTAVMRAYQRACPA